MPAERKRVQKKEEGQGIQLTWMTPVESASSQSIAFAPAVTPSTFVEEASPVDPDGAPMLFPTNGDRASPRKPGHGKKKAEDHIPRPPNAFILFRSSFIKSQHVSTEVETNHSTLSKIIGITWQNMPHDERAFWHTKAKVAQAEHRRKFPDYSFRPSHLKGKTAPEKRKVREVGPKDIRRCERIAALLVEGKKGSDLEEAIQDYDRNNVQPIIARFEAPLTARQYRRSSSQPPPESDSSPSSKFLRSSAEPPSRSRRLRAVSSQPQTLRSSSVKAESQPSPLALSQESSSAHVLAEDTWSDMPPLVLPPVGISDFSSLSSSDTHSFDFNPFIFNQGPPTYYDSCDPLASTAPLSPSDASCPVSPIEVISPAVAAYGPLSIDTSFFEHWSAPTSSPSFPSSPCTPQSYGDPFLSPLPPADSTAYSAPYDSTPQLNQYSPNGYDAAQGQMPYSYPAPAYGEGDAAAYQSFYAMCKSSDSPFYTHKPADDAHLAVDYSTTDILVHPVPTYTF